MARITDPQKIENVKRAAMEIIVEYGYRGASIAAIAKKANVSAGYLYLHYGSKEDLLDDLINTNLAEIRNTCYQYAVTSTSIYGFFQNTIRTLFELAKEDPIYIQLVATLVLDIDAEKVLHEKNEAFKYRMLEKVFEINNHTGECHEYISEENIMLTLMTLPFRYILLKIKETDYERFFQEEQVEKITRMCFNALR